MSTQVCRAFCRPKLIHGVEYQVFYLILISCMLVGFTALWNWERLILIPIVYFGPYTFFRWAGKHDSQWSEIYPDALRDRTIYYAHSDADTPEPAPPRRVIFPFPKFNP
jgi:type IV secretory pathway VirB3-like protein